METEAVQQEFKAPGIELSIFHTASTCIAAALVPGLGHAVMKKWDRALVFFASITLMFFIGVGLQGRVFGPDFADLFSTLKFIADAGAGLLYWVARLRGMGAGEPPPRTLPKLCPKTPMSATSTCPSPVKSPVVQFRPYWP